MDSPVACTIASNNYLSNARVFTRSFLRHHPDGQVYVLIVDRPHPAVTYAQEPFRTVFAEALEIPGFLGFAFRYNVIELNTAVKPYFLAYLRRQLGCAGLCYFDPDILITSELSDLYGRLEKSDVLLTPHVTAPIGDAALPSERNILLAGIYNLGFLGFAFNDRTEPFLQWWQQKLWRECLDARDRGLFVDQRWMDFAPAFLPHAEIVRDPGYNVAYWNLMHRTLTRAEDGWRVGESRLRFFHFSGFDPRRPEELSVHQNRYPAGSRPDLEPLLQEYAARVHEEGYAVTKPLPYAYGCFENGIPIPATVRRALRQLDPAGRRWPDPFATGSPESFYAWLQEPVDARMQLFLPQLALCLWDQWSEPQYSFPDPTGKDLYRFAEWFVLHGAPAAALDPAFVRPVEESLQAAGSSAPRLDPRDLPYLARICPDGNFASPATGGQRSEGAGEPLPAPSAGEIAWLTAPADYEARRPLIPRLAMLMYRQRADLIHAYPDPLGASREALALWFVTHARLQYRLDASLVRPVLRTLTLRRRLYAARWWVRAVRGARCAVRGARPEKGAGPSAASPLPAAHRAPRTAHASVASTPDGLNVIGWPDAPTGVGEMCRGTLAALDEAGIAHTVWKLEDPFAIRDGAMALDLREPEQRFDVSLFHVNADMLEIVRRRTPLGLQLGRYRIGYWFWELSHFPLSLARSFRSVDEVWAPSRFCLDAYRALAPVPVRWVPPCVIPPEEDVRRQTPDARCDDRSAADVSSAGLASDVWRLASSPEAFLFFNAFDVMSVPARKNPFGLLEAFSLVAKRSSVPIHLLLKVSHAETAPEILEELERRCAGLPVTLWTRPASRREMDGMIADCDAYVSLHRSEGLGVPLIEAMYAGKPVIATGYGGCTDFLDESTGWVVRHTMSTIEEPQGPYPVGAVWAEPDLEHAAALMLEVAAAPAAARERCAAAAAKVRELYSPAAAAARFRRELDRIQEAIARL